MTPTQLLIWPLLALASATVHAVSAKAENWTEGELALVGAYCIDTMGWRYGDATSNPSPRAKYWVGLMGQCFWHMHHYCNGMVQLRRAGYARLSAKSYLYEVAASEIHYVLKSCRDPKFVMLPELYTRLGEVELLRNRPSAAMPAYEAARRVKPDYLPAYIGWAEYLHKSKLTSQALTLVGQGLVHVPDSPELLRLFEQFGGDLKALPKPIATSPGSWPASAPASAAQPAPAAVPAGSSSSAPASSASGQ